MKKKKGEMLMHINYDTEKLNALLADFFRATGIDVDILKPDFSFAGERRIRKTPYCRAVQRLKGEGACFISDRELLERCRDTRRTEMSVCHAGLVNVAVPLLYEDGVIGYIIFGCIKKSSTLTLDIDFSEYPKCEREQIDKYYRELPIYDDLRIESIAKLAIVLAKYILLENMLKPSFDGNIEKAVEYIETNLASDLSIAMISKKTNVSKSVLYRGFHSTFGMTVSEYVKARRIKYSIALMRTGSLSVEELAQRSGFASASYFSREFKKQTGMSPARYKREKI